MTRQLVAWLWWIVMTMVVLLLIVGLTITAGPLLAAAVAGPAIVAYGLGEQRARERNSTVWRRSWSAAVLFLAAFLFLGWLGGLASLAVGAVVLIRARRASV
jgi:hypothetical protein